VCVFYLRGEEVSAKWEAIDVDCVDATRVPTIKHPITKKRALKKFDNGIAIFCLPASYCPLQF
jgi:hypothetical protein